MKEFKILAKAVVTPKIICCRNKISSDLKSAWLRAVAMEVREKLRAFGSHIFMCQFVSFGNPVIEFFR